METFFQSHAYLVEHTNSPIRRGLMDTIDWSYRLIGIRGSRGVGRTQFLLTYAKENFDPRLRQCLYANMNSFYFQGRKLVDFAAEFIKLGGQVLLIDQAFKLPNWREQIIECYNRFPYLRIVYSTTSVRGGDNDHTELNTLAQQYWLHGFSFREFINLRTGENFRAYTLKELLEDHKSILKSILPKVRPWEYFQQYLHHGYYPFFLESSNFTEPLLRAMNTMIDIDILFIKQIELKYLERIKKLLYLLAVSDTTAPNVSRLAEEIGTSRATVMNYLKYLVWSTSSTKKTRVSPRSLPPCSSTIPTCSIPSIPHRLQSKPSWRLSLSTPCGVTTRSTKESATASTVSTTTRTFKCATAASA